MHPKRDHCDEDDDREPWATALTGEQERKVELKFDGDRPGTSGPTGDEASCQFAGKGERIVAPFQQSVKNEDQNEQWHRRSRRLIANWR